MLALSLDAYANDGFLRKLSVRDLSHNERGGLQR